MQDRSRVRNRGDVRLRVTRCDCAVDVVRAIFRNNAVLGIGGQQVNQLPNGLDRFVAIRSRDRGKSVLFRVLRGSDFLPHQKRRVDIPLRRFPNGYDKIKHRRRGCRKSCANALNDCNLRNFARRAADVRQQRAVSRKC